MNEIKLTKTKLKDTIIGNISKMEPVSSSILLKGNCIHIIINPDEVGSNLKKNGVTCVLSFLPLELDGCIFQSNENLAEILKNIRDALQTAKDCYFVFDSQGAGVMLDDIVYPLFHIIPNSPFTDTLYSNYTDYANMVMEDLATDIEQSELNKLVQSKVMKIDTVFGRIRLSKNNVPLLGPASSSKPANFKMSYVLRYVEKEQGNIDYVLALHVKYKLMDAIHLYTVEPY